MVQVAAAKAEPEKQTKAPSAGPSGDVEMKDADEASSSGVDVSAHVGKQTGELVASLHRCDAAKVLVNCANGCMDPRLCPFWAESFSRKIAPFPKRNLQFMIGLFAGTHYAFKCVIGRAFLPLNGEGWSG